MIWVVAYSGWRVGSKADWFFGASVFSAVVVALWLALTIQRQALGNAADAVDQLRRELAAVAARSAEELAHARELHRLQGEFHRAEVEAHRELARVQRAQLLAQQQRQATIDVSRAIGAHTHTLAMLWDQGANIVRIEDPQEREQALQPIFERISQVVNDFAVELANAHVLVEDDRLHAALNRVNDAVLMAIRVAEDVHAAFIDGRTPEPNPIPPVQLLLRERAAEARHLAWELLSAGLGKA
ncbi:hypothetical protein MBOT_36550 [Mycobacterium botniense]|uniref:Uncharacterized protein n=2 Tax=Mycobacterium botniense TaxID=84962 RepID=A0A7I9Y2N0_9MYCO|nr:hypothetical protein MBOT_36550 [Mycobacterium botniense]